VVGQRFEVLHDGGEVGLVACTGERTQAQSLEAVMGLRRELWMIKMLS